MFLFISPSKVLPILSPSYAAAPRTAPTGCLPRLGLCLGCSSLFSTLEFLEKKHYMLPQSSCARLFIVTLNVIMIMMRVSCTLLTFRLSRLKLRPGLLSPFAHALTQTVCKMYHAYYVPLVSCIHKPFYFQLCLHGALTGYLCWPSTPHLLYEAAVVKFYCTAACCVRIDRNNLDAKESP